MNTPAFIINLPERPDRLLNVTAQLDRYGLDYNVWSAIKNDNGRLGLIYTMKELFSYAIANGFESMFVLEDDAKIVCDSFVKVFNKCMEQLPQDFDLFYAGCNLHGELKKYSENLLLAQGMYATHAILYSRKAIEKILPVLEAAQTYDITLVNTIQKEGKSFCSFPLLISQEVGYSDIAKKEINYEKFIEKRYAEKTKNL